jgi:hypothetical protein
MGNTGAGVIEQRMPGTNKDAIMYKDPGNIAFKCGLRDEYACAGFVQQQVSLKVQRLTSPRMPGFLAQTTGKLDHHIEYEKAGSGALLCYVVCLVCLFVLMAMRGEVGCFGEGAGIGLDNHSSEAKSIYDKTNIYTCTSNFPVEHVPLLQL